MPKPYLITRPSGAYVRFLVPADLRGRIGSRFIVRPLDAAMGDLARLTAARFAVALSLVFAAIRRGGQVVDIKKIIADAEAAARRGDTLDWIASNVRVGNITFGTVSTSGPQDTDDFIRTIQAIADSAGAASIPAPPTAMVSGGLLSQEIPKHLADLLRAKRGPETRNASKHTLRLLLGVIGDMVVGEVNGDHIREFWDAIRWWPEHASVKPEYAGMSVMEIIAAGRLADVPEPAPDTMKKHKQRLSKFFNALLNAQAITRNPLKGVEDPVNNETSPQSGRPFTPAELQAIYSDSFIPWASKSPHRWWGPILGLYTGARVTEIAQLYCDDIAEEDGVWGLHINNRFPFQKIKTKSSRRFVPLAQTVLDAGFLEFHAEMRASGHPRLFPHLPSGTKADGKANGLGYGRQLSRQFGAYLAKLGIEKGVAFHAFRHTVSTALDRAGYKDLEIARITGHTVAGSVLAKHYIDARTMPERRTMVGALSFPIELPVYKLGQFSQSLADADDLHS